MPADKINSKLHKSETHPQPINVQTVTMAKDKPSQFHSEESKRSNGLVILSQHDTDRQKLFWYLTIFKSVACLAAILLMMRFVGYNGPRERLIARHPKTKAILLWNADRDSAMWEYFQCGCVLTNKRDYAGGPIHAVVFNADRNFSLDGLIQINRTPDFLAVFAAKNPLSMAHNPLLEHGESVFNFTMTYRSDSNVVWANYFFTAIPQKDSPPNSRSKQLGKTELDLRLQAKTRFVFYMVYEVNEYSLRESLYLQELRNYLELDAFITCHGYQE